MCDTFVALPDATLDGALIFGKNSDRPNGEIQDAKMKNAFKLFTATCFLLL